MKFIHREMKGDNYSAAPYSPISQLQFKLAVWKNIFNRIMFNEVWKMKGHGGDVLKLNYKKYLHLPELYEHILQNYKKTFRYSWG